MEVDIQHPNANRLEIIVNKSDGLHPVDEFYLHVLNGIDLHDALQQNQRYHYQPAAHDGDKVVAHADSQTQTGGIPERGCCGQTSNFFLADKDRACTQKTDAADDLRSDTAIADSDTGTGVIHV